MTSTQITVDGLFQITVLQDGTATLDLAGKDVEIERHMSEGRLLIRKAAPADLPIPVTRIIGS